MSRGGRRLLESAVFVTSVQAIESAALTANAGLAAPQKKAGFVSCGVGD